MLENYPHLLSDKTYLDYNNVRMLHSVNKDWNEDVKEENGITPIKAESDEP